MPISTITANSVANNSLTTDQFASTAVHGRRNLIINGAMQVAQRGTVATGGSTGLHYGGPDRWRMYQENTAAAYTLSQDTNVPSGQGFAYSYKIDVTTADATVDAADRADFIYRFEGQDLQQIAKGTSGAKAMTLSFWISSPKTGTHIIEFFDSDNNRQVSIAYTVSAANIWEYKTVAIPADTIGTLNNDNDLSLQISWWLMAGSNYSGGTLNTSWASYTNANRAVGQVNLMDSISNNFYLTGVQLEVGSTATPFEHRSYGDELARCQRYYEKTYPYATTPGTASSYNTINALGMAGMDEETSGQRYMTFPWMVEKRAAPTLTIYDQAGNSGKVTTLNNAGGQTHNVSVALAFAGTYVMGAGPSNSAIWGLTFFCVGDSEL